LASEAPRPLSPGTVFSRRYRVDTRAAAGGMGTVYQATDLTTGQRVALKLIHDEGLAKERFQREVGFLRELGHPGIVRYIDHGIVSDSSFFLVMEWVEGCSLAQVLDSDGLTVAEAVPLMQQVADAIGAAHQAGMVHRDLKPDNIMLEGSNLARVKVIDFGIARRLRETQVLTRTGTMVGTPGYVAPEQARGDSQIDQRVDVFALGCVLYEALTGQAAYAGHSLMARLAKVLLGEAPTLLGRCPEAPPALSALVAQMLALRAAERPPDGTAVAAALATIRPLPDGPRRPCVYEENSTRVSTAAPEQRPGDPSARSGPSTRGEQPLICLVTVASPEEGDQGMATVSAEQGSADVARMRQAVGEIGGRVEVLADGSAIATIDGTGPEILRAAVRCARRLRTLRPDQPVALTIERRVAHNAFGLAIDRAIDSLSNASLQAIFSAAQPGAVPPDAIRLDPVAAQLLEGTEQLLRRGADAYLAPGVEGDED
jgi:eukaryotic-like serine/threonine-protein kinase